MSDNISRGLSASVTRRDLICGGVGAIATAAMSATYGLASSHAQDAQEHGLVTEDGASKIERDLEEAISREQKALVAQAVAENRASQLERELDEAKANEQKAREKLNCRSKAEALLGAPVWTATEFNAFLMGLSYQERATLKKVLGLGEDDRTWRLKHKKTQIAEIKGQFLWKSLNVVEYYWPSGEHAYHEIVKWAGNQAGVPQSVLESQTTFILERKLCEHVFAQLFVKIWEKLDRTQRLELLKKLDPNRSAKDRAALAACSGAAALAALSAAVYFAGFAFYTTLSVTICTAAGLLGITLPFAVYTTASSLVAFLSGPVGWLIMGLAAAVGVVLAGRANVEKTTAAIVQIHLLKVAAL